MKILFAFFSALVFPAILQAQSPKNLRLNFGLQTNMPEKNFNQQIARYNNKNAGVGFHLAPQWQVKQNIIVGIQFAYNVVTENYQTDAIGAFDIVSFLPKFTYCLNKKNIMPFAGLGLGSYHVLNHKPIINFGFNPYVGLSICKKIELAIDYNKIINKVAVNPKAMGSFDNYFLGIKASCSIGLLQTKSSSKNKFQNER